MNQNYFISKNVLVEGTPLVALNAKEYENSTDAATLSALKLNKSFDALLKKMIECSYERMALVHYKSSTFLVTKENMPYLFDCVENACNILGIEKIPEIYILQNESLNAYTTGVQNPILVLNSGLLHALNHEELMYIIGHELGHIKSEHVLYTMLANFYRSVVKRITDTNFWAQIASTGLDIAFHKWERSSELTADRAGLLVCQHLPSAITAMAKLCGCPIDIYDKLDANMFLKQVETFEEFESSSYNKFLEIAVTLNDKHPLGVLRTKALMLWVQSGEYAKILLRNSTWTEKEIERLSQETQKASDKKNNIQDQATTAMEKCVAADVDFEEAKQQTSAQTGIKRVAAWSTELTKGNKAKSTKAKVAKKEKQLTKAGDAYQKALDMETALRGAFKTASQEEIDTLTNKTLENLIRINK